MRQLRLLRVTHTNSRAIRADKEAVMGSMLYRGVTAASLAVAVLAGSAGVAAAATATSPSTSSTHFQRAQQKLESELSARVTRLANLSSDVTKSTTLTAANAAVLRAKLTAEQTSISSLVTAVPTYTTMAQLNAARTVMLRNNRVFAVMSPQVFETIGADAVLASDASLLANQSTLLAEVNSLIGQSSYKNALNHYNDFVRRTTGIETKMDRIDVAALAQTPQGYPRNTKFFLYANRAILGANISLAYAGYDESIISLSSGGTAAS